MKEPRKRSKLDFAGSESQQPTVVVLDEEGTAILQFCSDPELRPFCSSPDFGKPKFGNPRALLRKALDQGDLPQPE